MSIVKIEEVINSNGDQIDQNSMEVAQCCDKHILVNPKISVNNGDNVSYMNILDLNSEFEVQQLRIIIKEREQLIKNLTQENEFLKEQIKSLNIILDQLSTSTRNLATKNDIRIKVENSANVSWKKWYRRPKILLSGSAIIVLFSIYLRYKIKNW